MTWAGAIDCQTSLPPMYRLLLSAQEEFVLEYQLDGFLQLINPHINLWEGFVITFFLLVAS